MKAYDFTEREDQAGELLVKALQAGVKAPYRYIASQMHITPEAVRQLFLRVRNRYDASLRFGRRYRKLRARVVGAGGGRRYL